MILSSVLQAEIKFHTDYHGGARMDLLRAFFLSERENRGSSVDIRVKSCPHDPAVVCFNLRLSFTRIITEWVTDGFVTSFFV